MRLAAYAGALTNLAAQAAERQVTPEDRQLLDFAPPRDHGAALEALHAGGLVYHPLSSRSGAICPGVSRQAARPTGAGPPLRGAHPFLRAVYPESKGAAGGAPAGTGDCWPAASVRAAPPERQSTGRIAGPHRTPSSPRYSHATRTPARPVGRRGRGRRG